MSAVAREFGPNDSPLMAAEMGTGPGNISQLHYMAIVYGEEYVKGLAGFYGWLAAQKENGRWAQTKAFVKGAISYPKDVVRTVVTGGSVACESFSTACAQNVENSRRIGGALYDYNNDPEVARQVDLANKLATQQVMNDPVIQSQIAGRAAVATIVGTGGVIGMGLNVMAITGGALRASESGGTFVDTSELVQGALGVDLE